MKSFTSGITYLRQEAWKVGFIKDSDTDDELVERLSQMVRKWKTPKVAVAPEVKAAPKVTKKK